MEECLVSYTTVQRLACVIDAVGSVLRDSVYHDSTCSRPARDHARIHCARRPPRTVPGALTRMLPCRRVANSKNSSSPFFFFSNTYPAYSW